MKPFLVLDGQRIIDRQLAVLRPLFPALVIVAADPAPFATAGIGLDVIPDRQAGGLGPLAGLDAALAWLPAGCQSVVCVAGDMPFLEPALLQRLRDAAPHDAAAVVPRLRQAEGDRLVVQPLCARYHRSLSALAAVELSRGRRALHEFLDQVSKSTAATAAPLPLVWMDEPELRRFDPTLATFTNINDRTDLSAAGLRES